MLLQQRMELFGFQIGFASLYILYNSMTRPLSMFTFYVFWSLIWCSLRMTYRHHNGSRTQPISTQMLHTSLIMSSEFYCSKRWVYIAQCSVYNVYAYKYVLYRSRYVYVNTNMIPMPCILFYSNCFSSGCNVLWPLLNRQYWWFS